MKKLLIILTLGLMFGQVSQKVIEVTFQGGTEHNIEQIFPDYDLEWAILQIIECSAVSGTGCFLEYAFDYPLSMHKLVVTDDNFSYQKDYAASFLTNPEQNFYVGGQSGNYTVKFLITAEFPIEDTGYMEEDFDFCINEGLNLVSYPCENDIAINDALPSEISNNLSSIVGEGVAGVNVNGTWVGSLTQLQAGSGYWFKSSIEACFNYECAEN
tara:strand:- start:860 stop:1498 length:639 start_codon:yes stop_codon:yes gene_type:complete